jgi:hypothetical protein
MRARLASLSRSIAGSDFFTRRPSFFNRCQIRPSSARCPPSCATWPGVVVRFPVKISHGALLRLVDEAGAPLSVGSTATLRATDVTVPVGYDGGDAVLSPSNTGPCRVKYR